MKHCSLPGTKWHVQTLADQVAALEQRLAEAGLLLGELWMGCVSHLLKIPLNARQTLTASNPSCQAHREHERAEQRHGDVTALGTHTSTAHVDGQAR